MRLAIPFPAPSTHRARCSALRRGTALILAALLVGAGAEAAFAAGGNGGGGPEGGMTPGSAGSDAGMFGTIAGGGGGAAGDGTGPGGVGGKGGGGASGGAGGTSVTAAGAAGSDGGTAGGGGGGGGFSKSVPTLAGSASMNGSAGGAGGKGGSGGGGGEGGTAAIVTGTGASTYGGTATGGAGGNGGDANGAQGGSGGDGGTGVLFQGGNPPTFTNNGTIKGGNGGNGGAGGTGGYGGMGGRGGVGLSFASGGTLTNTGSITGGNGGADGPNSGTGSMIGNGGEGVAGAGLTITNSGTISGGLGGDGKTRGDSIRLSGGDNKITFSRTDKQSGLTGAIDIGGTLTFDQPTDATLDQAVSGFGSIVKTGAGTLVLTGTSDFLGDTTVNGGVLQVDGALTGATSVTVNGGGVLAGVGTIQSPAPVSLPGGGTIQSPGQGPLTVTVNAGGALAPGNAANPYGQLTLGGNLTFQPGSFFNVAINAAGQASSVLVNNGGTVTINGGTVQVNAGAGRYAPNTAYTILTAAAGVTGRFVDPPKTNLAFLVPTLSYTGTTVVLNIAANQGDNNNGGGGGTTTNSNGGAASNVPNYALVAQNGNQKAIGQALIHAGQAGGVGVGGQILTAVNQLTVPEARAAFASMSGEGVQATQSVSVQTASLFNASLSDQMTGAGSSNSVTMTEAQPGFMALAIPAPHHVRELGDLPATRTAPPPPSFEQLGLRRTWHAWASGYGAWDNVHGNAAVGTATQNTTVTGGAMGVDYQVTENYRLGLAVGGSTSSFDVPSLLTSGISNGGSIGLYNLARFGAFYGTGSFTFGYNSNKTTRVTGGFGGLATETLRAEFGSRILDARLEVGRDFQMASATLTPFMALDIADLRSNGFRESNVTGAGLLALAMAGQNTASVPGEIGLRYKGGLRMGTAMFAPFVEAAWVHDFAPQRSQTATLVNLPGAVFTVQGAQPAWNAARVKVGGELALSPTTKLFAAFNGRFSNSEQLYGGSGGIAWVW